MRGGDPSEVRAPGPVRPGPAPALALEGQRVLRLLNLGPFRNAYAFRGFAVWVGLRLAAAFLRIPDPNPAQEALILVAVAFAVLLDATLREEDIFLGNVGVPRHAIAVVALPVPLVLELFVA